ncbi:beta-lactamase/transpeptidase-like protein [Crepidotus variabilis]|uniref:Beta-lactamase/transpeptidase-like protein n=1 Tax=Crepidotus variabilis TaxID=179855 RepID=A0A9P6E463_9AGAR|nr:beta-lactamase/transpeptidase-like protein [Crepidotus variabilis]
MVRLTNAGKQALDRLVAEAAADPSIASFVFGVGTADGEIYFHGGGYRIQDEPLSGLVNPDSVFRLYSQSKTITCVKCSYSIAALHLIEQGGLLESDPVSKYLPEFSNLIVLSDPLADNPQFSPAKTTMTIKHLMNFSSGLSTPSKDPTQYAAKLYPEYLTAHDELDPIGGFIKVIKRGYPGIPLVFEPGTDFAYGWSIDILGFVIEKASGKSLENYIKKHICEPLKIKFSFYLDNEFHQRLVALVKKNESTGRLEVVEEDYLYNIEPSKVFCHLGGVGMYSSARDYLKLLRHLLEINKGVAQNPIISASTLSSIFQPALSDKGQRSLGLICQRDPYMPQDEGHWSWSNVFSVSLQDWPGRRRKGTGGWGGWPNLKHFVDPTTGIAVIFETQILPTFNPDVLRYYSEFEKVLYAGLEDM